MVLQNHGCDWPGELNTLENLKPPLCVVLQKQVFDFTKFGGFTQNFRGYADLAQIVNPRGKFDTVYRHRLGQTKLICDCHGQLTPDASLVARRVWIPHLDNIGNGLDCFFETISQDFIVFATLKAIRSRSARVRKVSIPNSR